MGWERSLNMASILIDRMGRCESGPETSMSGKKSAYSLDAAV